MSTDSSEHSSFPEPFKSQPDFAIKVLEHIGDGLAIADDKDILIYANPALCKMTGYSTGELTGMDSADLVRSDQADKLKRALEERVKYGKSVYEIQIKRESGELLDVQITSVNIRNDNEFTGSIAVIRDLTETKKREADLRNALSRAEEAKIEKEKFVASMSHEIRTPMGGILGMAQLLKKTDLSDEQSEYLSAIEQSAKSLTDILNDILTFSELDTSRLKLNRKTFSLKESIRKLYRTFEMRTDKSHLSFELHMEDRIPDTVAGDKDRFLQIMTHLVGNSFKFTDQGSVKLLLSSDPVQNRDGWIMINAVVEDTGQGVSEDLKESIFESFSKASSYMMSKYGGTGLGLTIVKMLVELMNGTIDLESSEGVGSTFTVRIPFELISDDIGKEEFQEDTGNIHETGILQGATVLIAEDHPVNQKLVKNILGKAGVNVLIAENGEEAIKLFNNNPGIDLILMDVHMPGMDGLEATRIIRSEFKNPMSNIPILAVTASAMSSDYEKCRQAGMDDFIAKPFTLSELTEKISKNLQSTKVQDADDPTGDNQKSSDVAPVDLSVLKELASGNSSMILQMLDLFLEQTPELIDRLVDMTEQSNWRKMAETAHKVKPTFTYLGMNDAFNLSVELEKYRDMTVSPEEEEEIIQMVKEVKERTEASFPLIKSAADKLRAEVD